MLYCLIRGILTLSANTLDKRFYSCECETSTVSPIPVPLLVSLLKKEAVSSNLGVFIHNIAWLLNTSLIVQRLLRLWFLRIQEVAKILQTLCILKSKLFQKTRKLEIESCRKHSETYIALQNRSLFSGFSCVEWFWFIHFLLEKNRMNVPLCWNHVTNIHLFLLTTTCARQYSQCDAPSGDFFLKNTG